MRKEERLTAAFTADEAAYIRQTAADNQLTVSEFIHEVLVGFDD